jgi:hypothetical protein
LQRRTRGWFWHRIAGIKILWHAGLLRRRRAGRSVLLYYRSEAGDLLVSIQNDGTQP